MPLNGFAYAPLVGFESAIFLVHGSTDLSFEIFFRKICRKLFLGSEQYWVGPPEAHSRRVFFPTSACTMGSSNRKRCLTIVCVRVFDFNGDHREFGQSAVFFLVAGAHFEF